MTETQKRIYDLTHEPRNGWDIAGDIAAEITALQERNAFLQTSAETAQAKLAEARAEVDRLTHGLALSNAIAAGKPIQYVGPLEGMKESLEASYRSALNESARQIGQMKQWLSEASAQNQKTSRELAECRAQCDTITAMRNLEVRPELSDALGRISELEAEVERLENARWDQG